MREQLESSALDLLELVQAMREDVLADAGQTGPQVGEPLRAEQQLTHDQQRPPLTDEVEGTRHPARIVVVPPDGHATSIRSRLLLST